MLLSKAESIVERGSRMPQEDSQSALFQGAGAIKSHRYNVALFPPGKPGAMAWFYHQPRAGDTSQQKRGRGETAATKVSLQA